MSRAGVVLFLLSITSIQALICYQSRQRNSLLQIVKGEKMLYNTAILELHRPVGIKNSYLLMEHDNLINKVVKEISDTLYVVVTNENSQELTEINQYISELYERLWDEMMSANNLQLKCYVVSNSYGNFQSFHDLCKLVAVDILYTTNSKSLEYVNNVNKEREIKPLKVNYTDITKNSIDKFNKIYFFEQNDKIPNYNIVSLGGTFDHLHNGHRKLLTLALSVCNSRIVIGVTSDAMLSKKKNAEKIIKFENRKNCVIEFINIVKPTLKSQIVELSDPYGPTITDPDIEAIIVSSETIPGALKINEIRLSKNMKALDILVTRRGQSAVLSSTFIRNLTK
jgi:cytidyltransferase-like protein